METSFTRIINLKRQLIMLSPNLVTVIFILGFVFYGRSTGNEEIEWFFNCGAAFIGFSQFVPGFILHSQYYRINKNTKISISIDSEIITIDLGKVEFKKHFDDIEYINIDLPYSVANRGFTYFMSDDYYYGKLKFKGEEKEITITSLLDKDLAIMRNIADDRTFYTKRFICFLWEAWESR